MFGNSAKTTDSSSSALSQIRAALSSSKNAAKPAMIEAEKPKDTMSSLLSRKIGNLSQTTNSESSKQTKPETSAVASAYSIIPTWLFSWKTMLVFIIIFAIVWIIRPYISMFSDIANTFKSIMGDSNEKETEEESIAEPTVNTEGEQKVKDMIEGTMAPTILEEITESALTESALTEGPIPDDAASSTQGGSQGGFCLAGEWKGKRTCVKVEKSSDCKSGQLFGTEAVCQNPTLRM